MKHLDIAMGLLLQGDIYLMQLRNGKNQAGKINFIGCFGGQIEANETALQAVCREVREESNFEAQASQAKLLGTVNVKSERHNQPITVTATVYLFEVPASLKVEAKEGELVTMTSSEVRSNLDKLTPGLRACFEELIRE